MKVYTFEEAAALENEIKKYKSANIKLRLQVRSWKRAAEAWMADYDALKSKYEPLVLQESSEV